MRSPNYPSINLSDAIQKAKMVYDKEFKNPAPREVLVKDMGYGGINGASAGVFSAVVKYGLLESAGNDQYRITEDALDIFLHQKGEELRSKAIEKLAFSPTLFAELRDSFGKTLPSDDNLKAYLVKKGFVPKAAEDAIRSYRATVELVDEETKAYNLNDSKNESKGGNPIDMQPPPAANPQGNTGFAPPALPDDDSVLAFKLSRNSNARVVFNGQVTQEAIAKLILLLEASQDTFPTQAELVQPKQATWRNKDSDQPVKVVGELGEKDGKRFYAIEGSSTGVPEDELEFEN
jgi:hypothetical protein